MAQPITSANSTKTMNPPSNGQYMRVNIPNGLAARAAPVGF